MTITHILKAVSACGTYRETLRCVCAAEADNYRIALESAGWRVTVKAI